MRTRKTTLRSKWLLRTASDALTPFGKDLSDQITFLGQELTPSSAASLKPQAQKLNGQGAKVFTQAEAAVTTANSYFDTLKAQ